MTVISLCAALLASVVISGTALVEDCMLRKSEVTYRDEEFWSGWNFGASPVLDIGFGIAMWNMWHGNALVRFDLSGFYGSEIEKATFRIYKPANITQRDSQTSLSVYQVCDSNADWKAGNMESVPSSDGASWKMKSIGKTWAGGEGGCGRPGVDYMADAIGTATASKYDGYWLEFDIPKALVQKWLDNPSMNAGLLLVEDSGVLGNHILLYSSEHSSGKGPQLVLEGKLSREADTVESGKMINRQESFPVADSTFLEYLEKRNFRYAKWATDPKVNMDSQQRLYPYYWDIIVYGEFILPWAYYPFSRSILDLDRMIEEDDIEGMRRFQINRLRYLHIWEYNREQRWYDCGDIIEYLSPLQAAYIWLGSKQYDSLTFDGVLYKVHPRGKEDLTEEDIKVRIEKEVKECLDNLEMNPEQAVKVTEFIRESERLRCEYYNRCNAAARKVFRLLDANDDGPAMVDALGEFMNFHDIYLFYDSYWQMYRWSFLMDNVDLASLCRFWKAQKYNEYSPARIEKRYKVCQEFYPEYRGKLEIVNLNHCF